MPWFDRDKHVRDEFGYRRRRHRSVDFWIIIAVSGAVLVFVLLVAAHLGG